MVLNFVTYIKDRQIASTYPSIDSKPDSKAKKLFKKFRETITRKCNAVVNAIPFIRARASNEFDELDFLELQGINQMSHLKGTSRFMCLLLVIKENLRTFCEILKRKFSEDLK